MARWRAAPGQGAMRDLLKSAPAPAQAAVAACAPPSRSVPRLDSVRLPSHCRAMARSLEMRVEIAVIGGGLAGVTLALAAAASGLEVALIDRIPVDVMLAAKFDGRTTALA